MKARGYPMERIDRMRPWLVAQVVTQLEYTAAGLDAENGVDVVMMRRAAGRKGVVPLESLDEQAALFAGLPAPLQETMLVEILREAQALLAVTRATLTAWEQGDEKTLTELLFGNSNGDAALGEFYERVFYGRNRTMTDRVVALSADAKPRFVVVGTGHLIGPQGIPELLAQRGFRVERVGSARVLPGAAATPADGDSGARSHSRRTELHRRLRSRRSCRPCRARPSRPLRRRLAGPAPPTTPAPVPAQQTAPVMPAPRLRARRPLPHDPSRRRCGRHRSSLLVCRRIPGSVRTQNRRCCRASLRPRLMEPSPAPPEAAPAPAQEPAPAPPPVEPKPKKKRLSSPKP